jgi:hypothetical protein
MKDNLILDLHKLYLINFSDSFDTNQALMQKLMDRHGLYFKDKEHLSPQLCHWWDEDVQVAEKFFDNICPGAVLNETQFARVCEQFMDFNLWEQVKEAEQILARMGAFKRLKSKN